MPTPHSDRRRVAVAVGMGLVLVLAPLLLLRTPTAPRGGDVLAAAGPADSGMVARRFAPRAGRSSHTGRIAADAVLSAAAAPVTTVPVATAPPATVARRIAAAATTTTAAPPPPPPATTEPPPPPPPPSTAPPPAASPPAPSTHTQTGEASWYRGPDGECAHNTAPIGSTIRVTNLDNGRSTTCRVAGRGPYGAGRIVDLTESTFARVAALDAGVFDARVEW